MADMRTSISVITKYLKDQTCLLKLLELAKISPSVCCSQNYPKIDKMDKCFNKYQHKLV